MPTINGKACVANGRNLIIQSDLKAGYLDPSTGSAKYSSVDFYSDNYIATNGATVFTFSSPDYTFKGSNRNTLVMYDSDKNYLGRQPLVSATQTLSKSNASYIRFSINSVDEGATDGKLSDWLSAHRYKLEKGSVATPLTPAPVDKVFSNGKQVYGRNLIQIANTMPGYIDASNGSIGAPNSINLDRVTGFIEVEPNRTYWVQDEVYLLNGQQLFFSVGIYDSNKSFINRLFVDGGIVMANSTVFRNLKMVIPENAKYVRVSFRTYGNAIVKLEQGTTATPWTPAPEDVM